MINKNIYFKELKRNRTSTLVWSFSICGLILLGMAFFPALMTGGAFAQMTKFFETPIMKNMLVAFGTSLDEMTNVLGFYCTRTGQFINLLGSFFSIMLASRILSEEEREQTAEFLLSKPVTRAEVIASKLATFFTYLVMLNLIVLVSGFISIEAFKGESDYQLAPFFIFSLYSFLLMLTFGAIGLFLSLMIKRGRPMTNISIGIVVGGYFLDILSRLTLSADKLGYLSPFKFIDSGVLRPEYSLIWWRVLYFAGLSFVLIALSVWRYRRRDILV